MQGVASRDVTSKNQINPFMALHPPPFYMVIEDPKSLVQWWLQGRGNVNLVLLTDT